MPLSSQTSIPNTPPPEHYSGMDDILIPAPNAPITVLSEWYPFSIVGTDSNDNVEITTMLYISSNFSAEPKTTLNLADELIKRHSGEKSNIKQLNHSEFLSQAGLIKPVLNEKGDVFSMPYTFSFESQGALNEIGKEFNDHPYSDLYRQIFHLLPTSPNQIFTSRVVREPQYFKTHPAFTGQYEYFLASLRPEKATRQSTLAGGNPLTRRFYTAHFSFEIPIPADADGNNQWLIEHASKRSEKWHLPEGELVVIYDLLSGYDFLPEHKNAKLKSDIRGLVNNLPGYLKSIAPEKSVPEMRYIEVPFGDYAMYGRYQQDSATSNYASIELSTAYKKGKTLQVSFSGTPALIKKYEDTLLAWVTHIKIMQ